MKRYVDSTLRMVACARGLDDFRACHTNPETRFHCVAENAASIPRPTPHREGPPPLIFLRFANQYLSHSPGRCDHAAAWRVPWRLIAARAMRKTAAPSGSGPASTDDGS